MRKIKGIFIAILFVILLYTRFVNLSWGLPYPFHPDERNMANAIQSLNCNVKDFRLSTFDFRNCFNPHFFAYGQFPLYLGYFGILGYKLITHTLTVPISFEEAVLSLRIISALASIVNVFILLKIIDLVNPKSKVYGLPFLIFTFSPFFIQFSHFGTTESLLMLLYTGILYLSLRNPLSVIANSLICGLAIATKVSSAIFIIVPVTAILIDRSSKIGMIVRFILLTIVFSVLFSPHNVISFNEFISAIHYESDVALGRSVVFYTRQFVGTIPVIFQFSKIFPYTLGWQAFLLGMLGFFGLSWKEKKINLLRIAFLAHFLPNAFLFAKWTRFMAPVLPLILVFAILFLMRIKVINVIKIIIILVMFLPGVAYLSIYQNPDVRFTASKWLYKNIKDNSFVLSETGNVVDLPTKVEGLKSKIYNVVPFNFYDLDSDFILQQRLKQYLQTADYVFIPSRRIFKNHDPKKYPLLGDYYQKLFSGKLGFQQIAELSSYPKISLFGKTLIEFPDEDAEETWSVFDHPVVRIYKRV